MSTVTVAESLPPARSQVSPAEVGLCPSVANHTLVAVLVSAAAATLLGTSVTIEV